MRFRDALAGPGLAAIAEIKRRSPSAGDLRPDADPGHARRDFERAGAAAMSVLVDERFGGSPDDLARRAGGDRAPAARQGLLPRRERSSRELRAPAPTPSCSCSATSTTERAAAAHGRGARARARRARRGARRPTSSTAPSRSAPTRSASTPATSTRSRSTGGAQLELVARAPRDRRRRSPRAGSSRARRPPRPSSPAQTRSSSARR